MAPTNYSAEEEEKQSGSYQHMKDMLLLYLVLGIWVFTSGTRLSAAGGCGLADSKNSTCGCGLSQF